MRPGIVMLVGQADASKGALARLLAARLPEVRVLDTAAVERGLFAPSDESAAERTVAFSAVLDAARYHLGRGRLVVVDTTGRRAEDDALHAIAVEAGAFVATIVCPPAESEPGDEYLTVDPSRPVADVVDLVVGYVEEMAQ
ncbi:MAG TPA: hypothetical protein VJ456_15005 [Acidimicrobiia bacterium]|nr:hypothetical protein [Acidimicrobiia bacterium]